MADNRRPVVAGNWKMHLLSADVERYVGALAPALPRNNADVLVFPSFPLLPVLRREIELHSADSLHFGAQDLHHMDSGPHTGDVSGPQLKDAGCRWVLCGHSERRADHGEDDPLVAAKVRAALRAQLQPLPCIGETAQQRDSGATTSVLEHQLEPLLEPLAESAGAPALAYEPVWAIGSGRAATPEIAQEAHAFIRSRLTSRLGRERGAQVRILYGGSVKKDNAAALLVQKDIDGFLVGGASLDPGSFLDIITVCGL